jgi:putative copper export protein
MTTWYHISIFLHLVAGAFWIGGMLFLPLVLLPGIKDHPDRRNLLMVTGLKFRFYGYVMLILILVTGLLNLHFREVPFTWKFFTQSHWGRLVSLKIILFLLLILISSIHDILVGRRVVSQTQTTNNKNLKLIASWTGRILLLISLVMAYVGVVLSRGG